MFISENNRKSLDHLTKLWINVELNTMRLDDAERKRAKNAKAKEYERFFSSFFLELCILAFAIGFIYPVHS